MLITPRTGANRENLRKALSDIRTKAANLQSGHGPAFAHLLAYLEWATESARVLRSQISDKDLAQLVFTPRYKALLASCGTLAGTAQQRLVNGLVDLELAERLEAFEAAQATLDGYARGWGPREFFVVADSSFYIQNDVKIADVDLHELFGVPPWHSVRLLFPIVVVDELDNLKDSGKQQARWRAAHTLGLLDGVLRGSTHGVLRPGDHSPQSGDTLRKVLAEIVLDPPGHERLPLPDDEIVDRTVAIQGLAGRDVHLLTCDTSQHTRARAAGLKVTKVATKDPGPEPDWHA
ncbi:PIN domain-containing protein [Streptomyces pseudovenezuelae]|uniref:PIN domain-containing protein n=1 Tax=Streptomyces pseudovenezuelae TaxID=67350 RepID=UPI0034A49470